MSPFSFCLILTQIFLLAETSLAAHILITTGSNYGSHFSVLSTVGRALVERGHTITALISEAYVEKAGDPQYSHLKFDVFRESELDLTREWPDLYAKYLIEKKTSPFGTLFHWMPPVLFSLVRNCDDMIDHFDQKKYYYDLFLLDGHSPCSVFLAGRLGIPYVLLVPSGIKPSTSPSAWDFRHIRILSRDVHRTVISDELLRTSFKYYQFNFGWRYHAFWIWRLRVHSELQIQYYNTCKELGVQCPTDLDKQWLLCGFSFPSATKCSHSRGTNNTTSQAS